MTLQKDTPSPLARDWVMAAVVLAVGAFSLTGLHPLAQPPKDEVKRPPVKLGLNHHDAKKACQGYTLLAPANSTTTYLLDMEGRVVKTWQSDCKPGHSAYLLENGHLLRAGEHRDAKKSFGGPGAGGALQEWTWDGELVWDFRLFNDKQLAHHR